MPTKGKKLKRIRNMPYKKGITIRDKKHFTAVIKFLNKEYGHGNWTFSTNKMRYLFDSKVKQVGTILHVPNEKHDLEKLVFYLETLK